MKISIAISSFKRKTFIFTKQTLSQTLPWFPGIFRAVYSSASHNRMNLLYKKALQQVILGFEIITFKLATAIKV